MVRNALALVGGVLILQRLPELPPLADGVLTLLVLALIGWRGGASWLVALCCGIAWAWLNAGARLSEDLPADAEGRNLHLTGCVATLPERANGSVRFRLDVTAAAERVPRAVELVWYEPERTLRAGDCIAATVRLRARRGFANPGGVDYEAQLFARGIGATGYVRELEPASPARRPWSYALTVARGWLSERIEAALAPRPATGLIRGLAVGDRQSISRDQWRTLAATGTSHLMAISGLHVGIVAALAAWLAGQAVRLRSVQRRGWARQDVAAACALTAATIYAALAGFAIPTQRALAMLVVLLLARCARRHASPGSVLGLAAVAVVLVDPFAPLSPGAWLSFVAVAAILFGMSGRPVRRARVRDFLSVQGIVTVCLLPVLVACFGQVSLIAPIANLLAVPLFTAVIVPLVLAGSGLLALSTSVGAVVLGFAAGVIECAWSGLDWLAQARFAAVTVAPPGAGLLGLLALLAWLVVAPAPWPLRSLALLGTAALLLRQPTAPPAATVDVAVLDVGQGLAVVVRTRSRTLLYDVGPKFRSGRDTGELVVLPYLRSLGVDRIDRLVASHGDLDHVGGLHTVVTGLPVALVARGPSVASAASRTIVCARGDAWEWDDVTFRFLHPAESDADTGVRSDNDGSCVLEIRTGEHRVLLTGDIGAAVEHELVRLGLAQRTTLLVAPHHGSRTSSSLEFVDAVRPTVVVFSAGHRNRWGFPLADVEQRWRDAGAATLTTAQTGAVIVRIDRSGIRAIETFRARYRRYWRT